MKERNEVSDSGDACDVCGLYLAETGCQEKPLGLQIVAGPGPRSKIESPINDEWFNGWDKERKTNRCRASLPAA